MDAAAPADQALVLHGEALAAQAPAWASLVERTADATLFAGPAFQLALRRAFAPDDPAEAVALWRGGDLAGLTPLARRRLAYGPSRLRELGFLRCAHTLRNHLLHPPDLAGTKAFLTGAEALGGWDVLFLENVSPEAGARVTTAAEALGLAGDAPEQARTLLHADIASGWEAYLASRSGEHRRQLKKRRRALEAAGRLVIERLEGEALRAATPDWRAVLSASWQAGDPSTASGPQDLRFLDLTADIGALWLLRLDGRPLAALRMLEDRRAAYVHTMHFVQAARDLAPGVVLFEAMMADAAARGLPRVDFNGHTPFFARWATGETRQVQMRVYARGLRGQAAWMARRVRRRASRAARSVGADAA
ncbi:MAG: GNAT family N-acetyltransferase [Rhodobacteraceae bacterium]|nr:MAG: GNAT family N-acetyltransferase [Paracoccaceae bacterium]